MSLPRPVRDIPGLTERPKKPATPRAPRPYRDPNAPRDPSAKPAAGDRVRLLRGGTLLEVVRITADTVSGNSEPGTPEARRFDLKLAAWKRLTAGAEVVHLAPPPAPAGKGGAHG